MKTLRNWLRFLGDWLYAWLIGFARDDREDA